MFLRTKLLRYSLTLVLINLFFTFVFLTFVASDFYRKEDQNKLKLYAEEFAREYQNSGFDQTYREEFFWIQVKENDQVVFQQFPRKIKNDEREIIKRIETNRFGFRSIDLSTLEEDDSSWDQVKSKLAAYLMDKELYTLASLFNDDFFDLYVLKLNDGKTLSIGLIAEEREEMLQDLRELLALSFIPALLIALILSYFMGRFFLRPIDEVMHSLKQGKVTLNEERAPIEMIQLKDEFNAVLDKNERLIHSLKDTLDNIAHDLKTPLTHLKMNSEQGILMDSSIESLKERLGENMEAADTILSILKSLMDVKEAESGTLYLVNKKVELAHLLEKVIEMHSLNAEEKNIEIKFESQDISTLGDETRLFQVFSNLLDNALKFSPNDSKIIVRLENINNQCVISFIDEGKGISEEELSLIWDRLYRGDKARSTTGFGIGLSLVKAYVLAHKGQVSVISKINEGSQFIIKLPICHN